MKKHRYSLRRIAETVGLLVLLLSLWSGRHVLAESFEIIGSAQPSWLLAATLIMWTNFVWSGLGYKVLAPKIRLKTVILVHMAASGPGRVIPAGGGHFGFGVLFLTKQRIRLERAIAIATVNNVYGFLVNIAVFVPMIVLHNQSLPHIDIGPRRTAAGIALLAVLGCIYVIYKRSKMVKRRTLKTKHEVAALAKRLLASPSRLSLLTLTMVLQIVTHVGILIFASKALGTDITPLHAFIAMSSGVAVGSIVPTPGGIGGVEAGIITALIGFGFTNTDATAIALTYRAITYLLPLLPGTYSYVYLRTKKLL